MDVLSVTNSNNLLQSPKEFLITHPTERKADPDYPRNLAKSVTVK